MVFLTSSIAAMICNLTPLTPIAGGPSMQKLPLFQCSNKARTPSLRVRPGTISLCSRGGDDNCLLRHAFVQLMCGSEASKPGGPCAGVLHDGQVTTNSSSCRLLCCISSMQGHRLHQHRLHQRCSRFAAFCVTLVQSDAFKFEWMVV